jgi:asparagine synthase (glutamine-hydrolysing)
MCGIGLVLGASEPRIAQALTAFSGALAHRGPDDQGTHVLETNAGLTLGMAHRRLSILDLSPGGHQPMVDTATGNVIVFNGEIYNHRELAKELEMRGERLVSSSDTEVLLKAYKFFNPADFLCRLRGMFAFAIWDAQQQRIFVARDPCGIKPLYYSVSGEDFAFACASEAKVLVQAKLVNGNINPEALDSYLAFGSVQAPLCIYQGIRSLLPGHMMWVNGDGTTGNPICYWDWHAERVEGGLEAISYRLSESMRRHLVSDVPVGVFLSGGFDSTAIATLATRQSECQIKTFTVSFPEVPEMSEGIRAATIAKRLGTEHRTIELTEVGLNRELLNYFQAMDQPSDDGLNVFLISKAVAEHGVKTCMHGVGGDELFGGYPSFRQLPIARNFAFVPQPIRTLISRIVEGDSIARSKLAGLLRTDMSLLSMFLVRRSVFSYAQRKKLLGREPPLGRMGMPDEWLNHIKRQLDGAEDAFAAISILELAQYGANKLLQDGDVMSMFSGLELRFPLLDVDLIRAALNTPEKLKIMSGAARHQKLLAKTVPTLPVDLIDVRKRGFTLPINQWMNRGEFLRPQTANVTVWGRLGLDAEVVQHINNEILLSNTGNTWLKNWQLRVLQKWAR